jgi:ubiquinone biosynthesis protein COQ9
MAALTGSRAHAQAMALGAMPQNLPYTLERLAVLMDEIWHLAGDTSTDVSAWILCDDCSCSRCRRVSAQLVLQARHAGRGLCLHRWGSHAAACARPGLTGETAGCRSELYMLTDQSPDHRDTWEFLDRRISDITMLARAPSQVRAAADRLAGGARQASAACADRGSPAQVMDLAKSVTDAISNTFMRRQ